MSVLVYSPMRRRDSYANYRFTWFRPGPGKSA